MEVFVAWISKALVGGAMAASLFGGVAVAQEGVYTADQAASGKAQFNSNCAGCHGMNLEGGDGPSLTGLDFLGNWATAGGIYGYFSVAMPPTAPGQLSEQAYVDILAYILNFNGIPAGSTELTSDPAVLDSIDLVALASAAAPAPADAAPAQAPATNVPQAFTFGKPLPGYDPGTAATTTTAAPATTTVPQAFTFGKDLPTVSGGSAGANP
jgi:S-disulfanyl-L-cysteine oxidoreductase SoxD